MTSPIEVTDRSRTITVDLAGRVAIVTGSTKGGGAAIARRLAGAGAAVLVTGRDEPAGIEVAANIARDGGRALFEPGDVAHEDVVARLVSVCGAHFGAPDVVVNAAAATDALRRGDERPIVEETTEHLDYSFRVGFYSAFWAYKYALPAMLERGRGVFVNVSSVGSETPLPARPAYAAVKAALNALSRQAAVEYGRQGIRSNTILAGDIGGDDPVKQRLREHAVAGPALLAAGCSPRLGESDDLADMVLFLASDSSSFVNGSVVHLDGGVSARSTFPDVSTYFREMHAAVVD